MAHTVYTGKSHTSSVKEGGTALVGWKEITIDETFAPAAVPIDITKAGDAAYTTMDNPLGGKGQATCKVTVNGLLSRSDVHDTGKVLSTAIDSTATVLVQKGSGAGHDLFTLTSGTKRRRNVEVPATDIVKYTVEYELDSSAGVWSTSVS